MSEKDCTFLKNSISQLTPLSTHWAPRKKNKKGVQSFSDTLYYNDVRSNKQKIEFYVFLTFAVQKVHESASLPACLKNNKFCFSPVFFNFYSLTVYGKYIGMLQNARNIISGNLHCKYLMYLFLNYLISQSVPSTTLNDSQMINRKGYGSGRSLFENAILIFVWRDCRHN